MDGYHHYTRPPPQPSAADPYHQYQYQQPQPPPPRPPLPPHSQAAAPWYPNQFQYQSPPVPSHAPPPQQQQWPPYLSHTPQFPPPPLPPPPPHHHQYSTPYHPQEWSNPIWSYQQTWNGQAQSNAEEWAARAKAWADAKAATNPAESQHASVGQSSHFRSQYQPAENSGYLDGHQPPQPGSGYQQHPLPPAPQHTQPIQLQDGAVASFGPSTYLLDGRAPFSAKDGTLNGALETHTQEPPPTNPCVHPQEVPSSYSSISGNKGTIDCEKSSIFPISIQESIHHLQPSLNTSGGPISNELPFAYGNQLAESTKDLTDQPLQFAPGFSHQDNFTRPGYAYQADSAATTSTNSWASPFVPEGDPSTSILSSNTGHGAQPFGRLSGPSFPTTIQPSGGQFGLGVGAAEPPIASFSVDAYGVSGIAERPKKASVPNWLREEIIKTKSAITTMPLVIAKDETEIEDEEVDKSFKDDQADAKSIDSPKLMVDEDDDEDYVEAARTAAINQEIKRVLTEVLLKVTDEIFDEIATKVLNEDDTKADGEANIVASDQPVLESSSAATTLKFSERVVDSVEVEKLETEDTSKSSGNSPPNILGLANYSSDDDSNRDGDELESSGAQSTVQSSVPQNSVYKETNAFIQPAENGRSRSEVMEHVMSQKDSESDPVIAGLVDSSKDNKTEGTVFTNEQAVELPLSSSGGRVRYPNDNKVCSSKNAAESRAVSEEKDVTKLNTENQDSHTILGVRDSLDRQNTGTSGRSEGDDDKQCSSSQRTDKEPDHLKVVTNDKEQRKNDERVMPKEKKEMCNPKEPKREHLKSEEREKRYRAQERKSFGDFGSRENIKDVQRSHKSISREEDSRSTRRQKDAKKDRPAPELMNDSERYKRRHSSPDSNRGKNTKDGVNRAVISSDEASDDSKRKSRPRKRTLSPSPVRSRRR